MEAVEAGFAEEVGARNVFKRSRALSRLPGLGVRLILVCTYLKKDLF
jgi:hypothetical protein